jgi:hypothetical protein
MGCSCRTFREECLPCQGVSSLGLPHTKTSPVSVPENPCVYRKSHPY